MKNEVKIDQVQVIDRRDSQEVEFTFVVRVKGDKASVEALLNAYANKSEFEFGLTARWKPEQCGITALYDESAGLPWWKSIGRTLVFR